MPTTPQISQALRDRRDAGVAMVRGGMTQAKVAELMGVHENTVYAWVRDAKRSLVKPTIVRAESLTIDPIRWDDLTTTNRETLKDFGEFRLAWLGRIAAPWAVEAAMIVLEAYRSDEREFIDMNVAPGVGKSTLFTHDLIVWIETLERALGHRLPRVLVGAMGETRAASYIRRLARTLTRNVGLIEAYGRYRPQSTDAGPWSALELTIEPLDPALETEKEATITGVGLKTGFLGGRFDINIWDDLVDKNNSTTPAARAQLIADFETEAESRVEPKGLLLLQGSRYGPEDLYFNRKELKIEDEQGEPKPLYKHIKFPAHFDELCDGVDHLGPWPKGCLLDPSRLSWADIRREKQKNEGRYRLVYQQEDSDPIGHLAERPWFYGGMDSTGLDCMGCFDSDRTFGQLPRYHNDSAPVLGVVVVDPSVEKYWALMHILLYPNEERVVLRGIRRPLHWPDMLYRQQDGTFTGVLEDWRVQSKQQGVPYTHVILEARSAFQGLLQYPFVRDWQQQNGIVILPHDTNRVNKADPNTGPDMLRPLYRQGLWRLPYGSYEAKLFSDQYAREAISFPEGNTSDLVMGSWFFEFNLPTLKVITRPVPTQKGGNTPKWARVRVPSFAAAALSGGNQ